MYIYILIYINMQILINMINTCIDICIYSHWYIESIDVYIYVLILWYYWYIVYWKYIYIYLLSMTTYIFIELIEIYKLIYWYNRKNRKISNYFVFQKINQLGPGCRFRHVWYLWSTEDLKTLWGLGIPHLSIDQHVGFRVSFQILSNYTHIHVYLYMWILQKYIYIFIYLLIYFNVIYV